MAAIESLDNRLIKAFYRNNQIKELHLTIMLL